MHATFSLKTYLQEKRDAVNESLSLLLKRPGNNAHLFDAMQYALTAGGKRLRPILCIAAAEAVGAMDTEVMTTACALEMIHTYSLIHDDLPAMDNDALRRGKPTCHIAFDEATAILAGDALLTLAFEIMSENAAASSADCLRQLRIIQAVSRAAGPCGMIAGQMMDIESEGKSLQEEALATIHAAKTGALIEASVYAGSVLGGGNDTQVAALTTYARHIGLAFQVADDILNVEGDPDLLGKAVGTDAARQKATYPSLIGLSKAKQLAAQSVASALKAIAFLDNRSEPLRALAAYVIDRKR